MHYRYPDHYVVGREKIREYAVAVKNTDPAFFEEKAAAELGYDGLLAPLTFISVFGYQAQSAFFAHADIGTTLDIYTHAINRDKLVAQSQVMEAMMKPGLVN